MLIKLKTIILITRMKGAQIKDFNCSLKLSGLRDMGTISPLQLALAKGRNNKAMDSNAINVKKML
jgi:hypothetical protein